MPRFFCSHVSVTVLLSVLAIANASCSGNRPVNSSAVQTVAPVASPAASPAASAATPPSVAPSPAAPVSNDSYQRAIARASSAYTISQSAQSQDDWRLVASRWQQAIDLMASVPATSTNHAIAQRKLPEYRRNLTYAQQQANRPTSTTNTGRVVVTPPVGGAQGGTPVSAAPIAPSGPVGNGVFRVPITRRMGGTPVVNVTFNGTQTYEMIVDTGASGTLITQAMASALGVTSVGQVRVDTASARDVAFPLGYVNSIEVGGAIATDVVVAVAGPDLSIGLLGHDFFGNFDVTIRQNEVEFRAR